MEIAESRKNTVAWLRLGTSTTFSSKNNIVGPTWLLMAGARIARSLALKCRRRAKLQKGKSTVVGAVENTYGYDLETMIAWLGMRDKEG
jgi:hypothetical protein